MLKFCYNNWVSLFLALMVVVSLLTGNKTLFLAMSVVLALRVLRATRLLQLLADQGISWGILIITIGFLAPIALEKYTLEQFLQVFTTPVGWIAVACGIFVAIMGARGVEVGSTDVVITVGIILGTFLGVAVFKGNPVGPLIGSGFAWLVVTVVRFFVPI